MPPLNDERFDEHLHALLREDEYLAEIAVDDEEDVADLARMRDALRSYKAETLHFSEQKSLTAPAPHVPRVLALWDSTPRWAVAATAVLAFGLTAVFATHRNGQPASVTMAAAPTAQALNEDNRLMLSVEEALRAGAVPTEEELGLTAGIHRGATHGGVTN